MPPIGLLSISLHVAAIAKTVACVWAACLLAFGTCGVSFRPLIQLGQKCTHVLNAFFGHVKFAMLGMRKQLKIFNAIICRVVVFVVNMFCGKQRSSQIRLHNHAMFITPSGRCHNFNIHAFGIKIPNRLIPFCSSVTFSLTDAPLCDRSSSLSGSILSLHCAALLGFGFWRTHIANYKRCGANVFIHTRSIQNAI